MVPIGAGESTRISGAHRQVGGNNSGDDKGDGDDCKDKEINNDSNEDINLNTITGISMKVTMNMIMSKDIRG